MEYSQVLPRETETSLNLLAARSILNDFYLAGGTGLALQIKHRLSQDLDFFTQQKFNESLLAENLSKIGRFQLDKKEDQTIIGAFGNTKTAFLYYGYPLLFPLKKLGGIRVADVLDIACMKIDAVASRGSKRDFIDLYIIASQIKPLPELLKLFQNKYQSVNYNLLHIKKGLVYFADAENEPMPKMLISVSWTEIKKFFENNIAP